MYTYYILFNLKTKQYFAGSYSGTLTFEDNAEDARKYESIESIKRSMYEWEIDELFEEGIVELKTILTVTNCFEE